MPLRVHMVRGTIFWPIMIGPAAALRISAGNWKGAPVMCVRLPIFRRLRRPIKDAAGKRPSSVSTLRPDYCRRTRSLPESTRFTILTRSISTPALCPARFRSTKESAAVLKIRLDSLTDAGPLDPKLFTPSPQMLQRNGMTMSGTFRFPMSGGISPVPTNGLIQPVIVHASVTNGKVEEIEPLQNSDPALSAAAVAVVKNASHEQEGGGFQREVFVNVRFMPPATAQPGQ